MIPFTAIDSATGEVLYGGGADDLDVLQRDGITVLAEAAPPNSYRDGDTWVLIPPRPSQAHRWDWSLKAWIDPRTLSDLRAEKWADIKAQRDAVEFGGFDWDGSRFDSDAISQGRITGAVQLAQIAGEGWSIDWTLADNSVRTLSHTDMSAVGITLGEHVGHVHDIARELRVRINAAKSAEELDAITWTDPPA